MTPDIIFVAIGDYEWQPPSEGQMKVLEARRERSDRISKLIGPYLLKGYKMLNDLCPECSVSMYFQFYFVLNTNYANTLILFFYDL